VRLAIVFLISLLVFMPVVTAQAPNVRLVADLKYHTLTLLDENDVILATYPIGTGRIDKPTKLGELQIVRKFVDPTWFPLNFQDYEKDYGKVWPMPSYKDDKRNPLGTRFMHLSWEDYGIHGTKEPLLIGRNVSSGCVRMNIPDVEELFDKIPVGTKVLIKVSEVPTYKMQECFSAWWGVYDILNLSKRLREKKGDNGGLE
jgi:lipoprotein-anchoring transpeptidase ErfK/SrfK